MFSVSYSIPHAQQNNFAYPPQGKYYEFSKNFPHFIKPQFPLQQKVNILRDLLTQFFLHLETMEANFLGTRNIRNEQVQTKVDESSRKILTVISQNRGQEVSKEEKNGRR